MEIELKLQLTDASVWADILCSPVLLSLANESTWQTDNLEAQYFDTQDQRLQKARMSYRIRREGGQWVATVKGGGSSTGGLHQRQEYNVTVLEAIPAIAYFSDTPVGANLQEILGDEPLLPVVITAFERHTLHIQMEDGSLIEVAADRGEIIAGNRRAPILEVELELKSGQATSLLTLGALLTREYPLLLESRSKYQRALQLAGLSLQESKPPLDKDLQQEALLQHIYGLLEAQDQLRLAGAIDIQRSIPLLLELWGAILKQ